MATNLAIDDKLLNEAKKMGHFQTKKETVNTALFEFIQRRKQARVLDLEGTVSYESNYAPKKYRARKGKA